MVATPPINSRIEHARHELARRRKVAQARRDLIHFCQYVDPEAAENYGALHLRLIANTIQRAMDGSLWEGVPGDGKKVLLITTPPGHWKSSLISRKFPAWFVGHQKAAGLPHQVIMAGYNASLAQGNNGAVLDLMNSSRYADVFPEIKLSARSQSTEEWKLEGDNFTTCKASGVGGGLTGYHCAVGIVDDPIKDAKDAASVTVRGNLWDWWSNVLRTRLVKGWDNSFILGVWTRWTEDDPAGRLMSLKKKGQLSDQVVMLRLPALAETETERLSATKLGLPYDAADPLGRQPGEALWPVMESAEQHKATRKTFPITFDALYQGRPRPKGGYMVAESHFRIIPEMPTKHVRWLWGTDWALTAKEAANPKRDPDYTVASLVGLRKVDGDPKNTRLVIGFIQRGQYGPHDARNMVYESVTSTEKRYPIRSGQANMDRLHLDAMRSDARFINFSIQNLTRKQFGGDKVEKATPWLEMAQAGRVDVVQGPWNEDFFAEVENFPHGAHDDQVDAISVAVTSLGIKAGPSRTWTIDKPLYAQSLKL